MKLLKYLTCGIAGCLIMALPLLIHLAQGWLFTSIPLGILIAVALTVIVANQGVGKVKTAKTTTSSSMPVGLETDPSVWEDDETVASVAKAVTAPTDSAAGTGFPAATGKVSADDYPRLSRTEHYKVMRDCQNAIDDAYRNYDRALKSADREYVDKIQDVNSVFYAALRAFPDKNSADLAKARKQYESDKAELQVAMGRSVSAAGAVLDIEIKHQHELMDDAG